MAIARLTHDLICSILISHNGRPFEALRLQDQARFAAAAALPSLLPVKVGSNSVSQTHFFGTLFLVGQSRLSLGQGHAVRTFQTTIQTLAAQSREDYLWSRWSV